MKILSATIASISDLLANLRTATETELENLDRQIKAAERAIEESRVINHADAAGLIAQTIKNDRDRKIDDFSKKFTGAKSLGSHADHFYGAVIAPNFTAERHAKKTLEMPWYKENAELALALESDTDIEKFSSRVATAMGCPEKGPNAAQQAEKHRAAYNDLERLTRERHDLKLRTESVLAAQTSKALAPPNPPPNPNRRTATLNPDGITANFNNGGTTYIIPIDQLGTIELIR